MPAAAPQSTVYGYRHYIMGIETIILVLGVIIAIAVAVMVKKTTKD